MFAEIIGVGDHWGFDGALYQANMQSALREMERLGIDTREPYMVEEEYDALYQAVQNALERSRIVLIIGGLGDTRKAITHRVLGDGMSLRFTEDAGSFDKLRRYCARLGRALPKSAARMISVPEGYETLESTYGLVPGSVLQARSQIMFLLPFQPDALFSMLTSQVMPRLADFTEASAAVQEFSVYEPMQADLMGAIAAEREAVTVYRYPGRVPECVLRVLCVGDSMEGARKQCEKTARSLSARLERHAYVTEETALSQAVLELYQKRGLRFALAEYGTDGLFSAMLKTQPGAQPVYGYELDIQAPQVRQKVLGVPKQLLKGPEDQSLAAAVYMARGVREIDDAPIGLAITGERNGSSPAYLAACDGSHVLIHECDPRLYAGSFSRELESAAYSLLFRMAQAYPEAPAGAIKGSKTTDIIKKAEAIRNQ